jgi:hypothetical protein
MSDPTATSTRTGARTTEVRGRTADTFDRDRRQVETKPFFETSEFWVTVLGIAALIVVYNATDDPSLDLFRLCLLCTLGGMAYVVSRGLAKAGAARRRMMDRSSPGYD